LAASADGAESAIAATPPVNISIARMSFAPAATEPPHRR
jgi:hypothetical protein